MPDALTNLPFSFAALCLTDKLTTNLPFLWDRAMQEVQQQGGLLQQRQFA
jgi:hypothetical protein